MMVFHAAIIPSFKSVSIFQLRYNKFGNKDKRTVNLQIIAKNIYLFESYRRQELKKKPWGFAINMGI
jgi:hypothetical protein